MTEKGGTFNGIVNQTFDASGEHIVLELAPKKSVSEQFTYSWEGVNVYAKTKKCENHILKNGELVAIMGASGSGKTTLLNVLTGRSGNNLKVSGELYVNGVKIQPSQLTSKSAYVQQEDLFIPTLTVKEQLNFQAMLRMDSHISKQRRMLRIEEVITELGLGKCQNTLIGEPGRIKGISGGETKRLAFACEVLTNPPLMFCDEPTTGLDSFMAQNVVTVMKAMADSGRAIISTIHQPSSEVFALFDRVLILAEGRLAYLGLIKAAMQFCNNLGARCPKNYNPADFFISTLAIEPGREEECQKFVSSVCDAFEASQEGKRLNTLITQNMRASCDDLQTMAYLTETQKLLKFQEEQARGHGMLQRFVQEVSLKKNNSMKNDLEVEQTENTNVHKNELYLVHLHDIYGSRQQRQSSLVSHKIYNTNSKSPYKASWWTQFSQVTKRSFTETVREPQAMKVKLIQTIMVSLLIGLIYLPQEYNQAGINNINGILFLISTNLSFTYSFGAVKLPLFLREHHNGMYRTDVYFLAKTLAEIPSLLILPGLFVAVMYYIVALWPEASAFFICIGVSILVAFAAMSFGFIISAISGKLEVAIALAAPMLIPLMLFGGFFLNSENTPVYFIWLQYISWFNYANRLLVINQWEDATSDDIECEYPITTGCLEDGPDIIHTMGYDESNFGPSIGALVILFVLFEITAFGILFLRAYKK